ncbi:RNA polymerase sigma-70 factor [Paenibacillus athensensis]|uniref:RNA polymerase sigma-70 factor n=1 Tax=Paenibacillus athensensis TaxID=1967502 RepID=A0A4Y8Q396_9BACL|nr:RNA polymerase sigma-70 factor [Paenibacillus athensensis]MCD1258678.1 RNA polymerase sigma-70 factor [Paenibacillus athensensis]
MDHLDLLYTTYKPLLFSIAYRMLGSVSDAEDMVHDAFLGAQRVPEEEVRHPKAYLCKMVVNRCIDFAQSARKQREVYVGPWLPEPLLAGTGGDPQQDVERSETLSYAFLVCLEMLTPVERAVFILREAFAYTYAEIAEIVGKTEANCRQLYARVKRSLQDGLPAAQPEPAESRQLLEQFLRAARTGDMAALLRALSEDAALYSDGGGKAQAATKPIFGPERVAAFLAGLGTKGSGRGEADIVTMNGHYGLLLKENGRIVTAINWEIDGAGRIRRVYLLRNPDKLLRLS